MIFWLVFGLQTIGEEEGDRMSYYISSDPLMKCLVCSRYILEDPVVDLRTCCKVEVTYKRDYTHTFCTNG